MDREVLINDIIKASIKRFGEGSAQLLSSKNIKSIVGVTIPTDAPGLDRILAKGPKNTFGVPGGRITGISGKEASGKTTFIMTLIKNTQQMNGLACLIETEHAFDPLYAKSLGINLEELILFQPDYLEQGLDMVQMIAESFREARKEFVKENNEPWNVPLFIGFDSIAGVPPKAELEADSYENDQAMGLHARRLSKFFRTINGLISREQISLVCTNQTKTDVRKLYGDKSTEMGGAALKFHASVRLDIQKVGFIKEKKDGDPIGIETMVKSIKNKCMVPYKTVKVPIIFGQGISYPRALAEALLQKKIIQKSAASYTLNYKIKGNKFSINGHGIEKFIKELEVALESPLAKKKIERLLDKDES